VHNVLSQVRSKIALDHKLYNKDDISLLWVRNFPMFEKTPEGKRKFTHNPFSMPRIEDLEKLLMQSDIESIVAQQYDIVMNGSEI
jgi:aspartyl-tRNA synthetase